jgi:cellulose synthase/poly-beta-1,6-N-acetylglucosamine synthase-like glycosyltransferase
MLSRCLDALAGSASPAHEVIAVFDGGADNNVDTDVTWIEDRGARVVRVSGPRGPAWARNHGAATASGDVLFFVDADTEVHADTIGTIQAFFHENPELAAVIGTYDDEPAADNFLSQYKNLLQHHVHMNAREEGFTFWGACGAMRREVFLELGGFCQEYGRPCIEDIELGYRLVSAGHRVHLRKDLQVKHLKRWTMKSLLLSDVIARAVPWTRLILRSGRFENDLNINVMTRVKVSLVALMLCLLLVALWWPLALVAAAGTAATLAWLDLALLRFFARKRGVPFAARTITWHWFYYFYSGCSFCIGLAFHLAGVVRGHAPAKRSPEHVTEKG